MNKSVVLVTGGTGFVGSHLLELLEQDPNLELHATAFGTVDKALLKLLPKTTLHQLDLTQFESTALLIQKLKPDQIYHLASFAATQKSFAQAEKILSNNTILQLNLLEVIRLHAPKAKVLCVCSADEYGISLPDELPMKEDHPFRPIEPYAVSKICQDMLAYVYASSYHLNIVRVRPFNHIGERQTEAFAVSSFAKQIAQIEVGQAQEIKVGNLDGVRDFTDVKDMVRAYKILMEKGQVGEVYNVGSGQGVSMREVLNQLILLANRTIKVEIDPDKMRPSDIKSMVADASKIRALGWQSTIMFKQTLTRVLDYWRGQI